ncbi:hypothetical protein [Fulvivirga ligni]|uniref:hypothetical protein n=1 Tax=Fulvivirga ligni TaxID=2904246 RepID=UPI001F3C60A8|nr:hypothetical protein [Fulvivirga ligni]UII22028.1 hypothetical protein LVD16_02130 [Fulvivirga ligni]
MGRLYKYFNILSLDVALGATICSWFVAWFLKVELPLPVSLILGLTVWLIYSFDHLLDARQVQKPASSERHRFHQRYFKSISYISVIVLMIIAALIFILPIKTVVWGASIGALVLAYFILLHFIKVQFRYQKEMLIAFLYAAGIMVGPLSIYEEIFNWNILIIYTQFVMLALSNLFIFSVFENEGDEQDGFPSIARNYKPQSIKLFLKYFLAVQLALAIILSFDMAFSWFQYTVMVMLLALVAIVWLDSIFKVKNGYRWLGDAIFLFPLFTLYLQDGWKF